MTGENAARLWSRLPHRHSLNAKILLVGIVFSLVPFIIYDRLGDADREKSDLLLKAAREQSNLIAAYLTPKLKKGPSSLPEINEDLRPLSGEILNIRILFRPASDSDGKNFYYVAASPPLGDPYLHSEIQKLDELGVLSRLAASCTRARLFGEFAENETVGARHSVEGGPQQLITVITPVATDSGCWSIITSFASEQFLDSPIGRPYWQSPEIRFASVLYFSAAAFTIVVLLRIRGGLRVFRNTAVATGRHGDTESFAKRNRNPDLDEVASEFDRMVQRIGLLSFAVERSPIAITIADSDWHIEYVNPAYERLSGKWSKELLGRDLRHKEFESLAADSWADICARVAGGETWHGEIRRRKPDGRRLWADVSLYRLVPGSGDVEHYVCLQEDVSERKQILNDLVAEKEKAETLNQMKSNFVARMSHEFRTPLNAILGFSEIIANEIYGKCDNPKYIEYADNIHSSGAHLLSLINDVLDLSKLESGKESLFPQRIDLSDVINDVATLVAGEAAKQQVTLKTVDRLEGFPVFADRRAVKQVLLNLLSNGIKFTPQGGSVIITAEPRQDAGVRITIADSGCGIDQAEIPKICEPYERAGSAYVRNAPGTGLGLPIVKRLVELQNGELHIASELGAGTTVTVTLPGASGCYTGAT